MALTVVLQQSGFSGACVAQEFKSGRRSHLSWYRDKGGALYILDSEDPDAEVDPETEEFDGDVLAEFAPGTWMFVREQE